MTAEQKEIYKKKLNNISEWINSNEDIIFKAYIDILIKNKYL